MPHEARALALRFLRVLLALLSLGLQVALELLHLEGELERGEIGGSVDDLARDVRVLERRVENQLPRELLRALLVLGQRLDGEVHLLDVRFQRMQPEPTARTARRLAQVERSVRAAGAEEMEARRAIAIAIHRCAALITAEPMGGRARSGTTHRPERNAELSAGRERFERGNESVEWFPLTRDGARGAIKWISLELWNGGAGDARW